MAYNYKITLFTPTYNRAYIIERLYKSIQRQTYRDFEWIIYDDGSTDNTEEMVNSWLKDDNDFPIRFYKGKNGGKCRATNRALEVAEGEIFFTIDSDDYLTDDACEKINGWMESIRGLKDYCGIVANRGQTPTETRNTTWRDDPDSPWYNKPYRDATFLERYEEATRISFRCSSSIQSSMVSLAEKIQTSQLRLTSLWLSLWQTAHSTLLLRSTSLLL